MSLSPPPRPVPSSLLVIQLWMFEATWVVTATIYISRRSFASPFLVTGPPPLPHTTLAARWSMKVLPCTPRRPKGFNRKVGCSIWAQNDVGTAV